jgi:subtilase family serine protease
MVSPADDESVSLLIGAKVKTRLPFSDKDRSVTVSVDPDHTIRESNQGNNTARHNFSYD